MLPSEAAKILPELVAGGSTSIPKELRLDAVRMALPAPRMDDRGQGVWADTAKYNP